MSERTEASLHDAAGTRPLVPRAAPLPGCGRSGVRTEWPPGVIAERRRAARRGEAARTGAAPSRDDGGMRRELVFTAYPGRAELARRVTLAEAGLKERADLQEWIRAHPQILGNGVRIVTYEFDRWVSGTGARADRLDLLGLDENGRLVLAELKRDAAPDTVEMQAIKYAAYASRFTVDVLAACHADYLRRTLGTDVSDEEALAQLDEHCGGLDRDRLAAVRIVLVAGSFPEPVTASVVWLCT